MKTLYINRHAKSSWANMGMADFDRPLNNRGENDAPMMGKRLKERGIIPDYILSSPANRAITTARTIATEIGYLLANIKEDRNLYHASEVSILEVIKQQDDENDSLMIFGHNPGFTDLASILSGRWFDNIPTCGIVAVKFETENWKEVAAGNGEILFFDYPKNIR